MDYLGAVKLWFPVSFSSTEMLKLPTQIIHRHPQRPQLKIQHVQMIFPARNLHSVQISHAMFERV